MKNLTKSEFISLLYSERDRLYSQFSKPGWSNWAIGGAIIALFFPLIDSIATTEIIRWNCVLLLFVGFIISAALLKELYSYLFPQYEIYFKNRIAHLKSLTPRNELIINLFSCVIIFTLFIVYDIWAISPFLVIVFGFFSVNYIIALLGIYLKRKDFFPTSAKYIFNTSDNVNGFLLKFGLILFMLLIVIISSWSYVYHLSYFILEFMLAAYISGIYLLTYIFININSKPNKILNEIDNIIEFTIYGNLPQDQAIERLTICQYGLKIGEVVDKELDFYFRCLKELDILDESMINIQNKIDNCLPQDAISRFELLRSFHPNFKDAQCAIKKTLDAADTVILKLKSIPSSNLSDEMIREKNLVYALVNDGINRLKKTIKSYECTFEVANKKMTEVYCCKHNCICEKIDCADRMKMPDSKYQLKPFNPTKILKGLKYIHRR